MMAGIVGAAHIGKHMHTPLHRFLQNGEEKKGKPKPVRPVEPLKNEQTVLHD
jgi:NADH-quinone oxidoreductase subunit J